MVKNSTSSGGKYISVHLRFEEVLLNIIYKDEDLKLCYFTCFLRLLFLLQDMVAFSCCIYDGGEEEQREMDIARERSWRGKFRKRGRIIKPGAIRMDGKCPLTPLEVCFA